MQELTTVICLPPGPLAEPVIRRLLERFFVEHAWFVPARYGTIDADEPLPKDSSVIDELLSMYARKHDLTVAARTNRNWLAIRPNHPGDESFFGDVTWSTSASSAKTKKWRDTHGDWLAKSMTALNAPLGFSSLEPDHDRQYARDIPEEGGGYRTSHTVRHYGEGLAGLSWRNVFGAPFVRLFGDRLATLPEMYRRQLGPDLWLVEPYENPADWNTDAADAARREIVAHLGADAFYDHDRHATATRVPRFEQELKEAVSPTTLDALRDLAGRSSLPEEKHRDPLHALVKAFLHGPRPLAAHLAQDQWTDEALEAAWEGAVHLDVVISLAAFLSDTRGRNGLAHCEHALAHGYLSSRRGDPEGATAALEIAARAIAKLEPGADRECFDARLKDQLAYLASHAAEPDCEKARTLYASIAEDGPAFAQCKRALGLAYVAFKNGDRDSASNLARAAVSHAGDGGFVRHRAIALGLLSRVARGDEARQATERAAAISAQLEDEDLLQRTAFVPPQQ